MGNDILACFAKKPGWKYVFIRHKITREKENIGTNSDLSWNREKGKKRNHTPTNHWVTFIPSCPDLALLFKFKKEETRRKKSLRLVTHTFECMT